MDAIRVNKSTRVNQVSSRTHFVRSDSNLIDFFIGDKMKRCSKCKQSKSISEFYKSKSEKDGLQSWCKACRRDYKQTEKGKASTRRYNHSENRKIAQRHYYCYTIKGRLRCIFNKMSHRCNNPENTDYNYYGGRGIKVKFVSFNDFYDYVTNELKADPRGLTIDRINNDGHYERGNIRFVTRAENNRNKRKKYAKRVAKVEFAIKEFE